jgi:hypothetical protein
MVSPNVILGGIVFLALFVAPPLFIAFDQTEIFEEMPTLGGDPTDYLTACGYETISVDSDLTVDADSGPRPKVIIDPDNQFEDHLGKIVVSFDVKNWTTYSSNPACQSLMIYIDEVEERALPNNAGHYCKQVAGTTVVDNTHAEQFKYSCCIAVSTNCTKLCEYLCPIPPAMQPEFHENLLGIYSKPVHIKSLGSQTPWLETEKEFSFDSSIAEAESVAEMTYARVASSIGFITLASGILAGAVSTLNGAGEETPATFMIGHVVITIFMIWTTLYVMKHLSEENSPFMDDRSLNGAFLADGTKALSARGWLVQCGLSYVMVTLCYSLFLVYVPHQKQPDEDDAAEQRFPVTESTCPHCCGKGTFLKFLNFLDRPFCKGTSTLFYAAGLPMQVISMYAIIEVLAEVFKFGPEEVSVFALWYFAICLIFLVAFITAIYKDPLPVVVVDGALVAKKSLRRPKVKSQNDSKKVIPKKPLPEKAITCTCRPGLGGQGLITEVFKDGAVPKYKQDELWVIHTVNPAQDKKELDNPDYLNANFFCDRVKYHNVCWHVGNFVEGKFVFFGNEDVDAEESVQEWIKSGRTTVDEFWYGLKVPDETLPLHINNIVLRVIPSEPEGDEEEGKTPPPRLLPVGSIKNGRFVRPKGVLATFLKIVLRLEPDYTDPMFKNHIVDSLREQMFRATKTWGTKYSTMYWFLFGSATFAIIVHMVMQLVECINVGAPLLVMCYIILEFLLIIVLTLFSFMVTTERKNDESKIFDGTVSDTKGALAGTRGSGAGTRGGGGSAAAAPKQSFTNFVIKDIHSETFNNTRKCANLPPWATKKSVMKFNGVSSHKKSVTILPEIQYTKCGKLEHIPASGGDIYSTYIDIKTTCICKDCRSKIADSSPSVLKDVKKAKDTAMLILDKAARIDMSTMEGALKALHVDFQIDGLKSVDRVAFGLAYADDALAKNVKTDEKSEKYKMNKQEKKLFACPLSIEKCEGGGCDVSGKDIDDGENVIKLSKDEFYAAKSFIIHDHNPSGWLAFSISAEDGSVTVPVKFEEHNGFCRRFESEQDGGCDVSGNDIGKGDIVYAYNYSNGESGSGKDWWCGKDGLKKPVEICEKSDLLKTEISKDGTFSVGMGFDGHSFYVSKGNGQKIVLNGLDGRREDSSKNLEERPLSFIEWGWGAKFYPVIIVYSEVPPEAKDEANAGTKQRFLCCGKSRSKLTVTSQCFTNDPILCTTP